MNCKVFCKVMRGWKVILQSVLSKVVLRYFEFLYFVGKVLLGLLDHLLLVDPSLNKLFIVVIYTLVLFATKVCGVVSGIFGFCCIGDVKSRAPHISLVMSTSSRSTNQSLERFPI